MTHYNADYTKLSGAEKVEQAIHDTWEYLGCLEDRDLPEEAVDNVAARYRQEDIGKGIAASASFEAVEAAFHIMGVQGFPVIALCHRFAPHLLSPAQKERCE